LKWLLIAVWLVILTAGMMWWKSRTRRKSQARVAKQRTGLDCAAYVEEMANSGVSANVSTVLYDELATYCTNGVRPNPDDGIFGFYLIYSDELEDLIPALFGPLGVPLPNATDSEIVPYLESARHLAVFLQAKVDALNQP
jgi:hypothetical protein